MNPIVTRLALVTLVSGALMSSTAAQTILFSDNFDGGTGDLSGTTPDTTTAGAVWVATPTNFLANGTIGGTGGGTATLAFTPVDGFVYTLDASFTGITGDGNWIALGFVNGQGMSSATSGPTENRFLENQTVGIAWMLARGDNSTNANTAFLGNDAINLGNSDGIEWSGGPTNGGNMDLRVVLDTTGGTGNWTATWYAKQDTDGSYTTIRATTGLLDESITSVGFGKANTGISGVITSFSLSASGGEGGELPSIIDITRDGSNNVILTLDGPAAGLTVQQSDDLGSFSDVASTPGGNTLTIDAVDTDPDADGADFYRVRN